MKNIKCFLIIGLLGGFSPALANELTVLSAGGAFTQSHIEAYHKPFTAKTGIKVNSVDGSNPPETIRAQVKAGNVRVDVSIVGLSDTVRFCEEGLLEPIDHSILLPAPDGTPAAEDFLTGSLQECGVANVVLSLVFAYNTETNAKAPKTIADFFDLTNFPGKRGMRKAPNSTLEMALMADGVPPSDVYQLLSTEAGVNRAFAKLDTIKEHVVWWLAPNSPPQLLASGEVAMSSGFNGRLFGAAVGKGEPIKIVWHGQVLHLALFVIPKGAPNKENALKYIAFATGTEPLAAQASWISYGPARKSSVPLVGVFKDGKTQMQPHMPTATANLKNALVTSYTFWAKNEAKLNERFDRWLAE